jgi:hypothetical protein
MISSVFHGVAGKELDIEYGIGGNLQIIFNWVGLCFFLISDAFISMTFA